MRLSNLLGLVSLCLVGVLACEKECKIAMDNEFASLYTPVIMEQFHSLEQNIVSTMSPQVKEFPELEKVISRAVEGIRHEALRELNNIMHHGIFDKYHARCYRTELEGCPNYYCEEVCGSPGSIIYYLDDVLSRTRLGVAEKLQILTEEGSGFEEDMWKEAEKILSHKYDTASIENLRSALQQDISSFHQSAEHICSSECFEKWSPGLIAKLQTFD
ncbi:hypothetical protein K493DRAFT_340269 [Basidiobolus meristosporus CBS 931.73]|uniref:Uncharacterized protein n=1 Tax=Basidiobolus meristosporus CBS 931.73 TaxID=1314790 RepID=A0A1Y1XWA0_9FUNG|nr:hypothetical protein K493DRAFT_340269 [Basidiobolus meristosporus CBS 931.73]|eukprot:ORX90040.1 hypothetical protein K493DRAFT_340269 [Basidiobolus meristosporus CBS 931.73]